MHISKIHHNSKWNHLFHLILYTMFSLAAYPDQNYNLALTKKKQI